MPGARCTLNVGPCQGQADSLARAEGANASAANDPLADTNGRARATSTVPRCRKLHWVAVRVAVRCHVRACGAYKGDATLEAHKGVSRRACGKQLVSTHQRVVVVFVAAVLLARACVSHCCSVVTVTLATLFSS